MDRIKYLDRIKKVENRWDTPVEDLLYQMHWGEDMMHREIGEVLGLPRPTVTRWFAQLAIPTQSCRRFTDKNLTSWLYKTGKLKKKLRYDGPDRRIQRTKGNVVIDFFKRWSPEMAYVLGFFAADGGMFINSEGSKYIQFVSTDREILIKIKNLMGSTHKIGIKKRCLGTLGWKKCYLIQIGSKEMYNDLLKLGFTPKKDLTLKFPKVPNEYLSHFVRGYFDGDGSVVTGYYLRKNRNNAKFFLLRATFTSGSRPFLRELSRRLRLYADIGSNYLGKKQSNASRLAYSTKATVKLFNYMYKGTDKSRYLERKYDKFQKAIRILGT
ncbi:MAG: hypothetical protein ISS24_02355 [Candidatus Omnitrophica bacterium]|nr:hypothetical protein [Candidatus Omnitrophota bacterium]